MARVRRVLAIMVSRFPGRLRLWGYRWLLGATIGSGSRIGFGTVIVADTIRLGANTTIGSRCEISAHRFETGAYVTIGPGCKVSCHTVELRSRAILSGPLDIKGAVSDSRSVLKMGRHAWIFEYCYIDTTRAVTLEDNVGVGGGSYIFTHGFWLSELEGYPTGFGPVLIKDNTWLPWGCFIMPGVTIGRGVIVGARSLVNRDVPDGALVAGMPAKVIRERSNREMTHADRVTILERVTREFAEQRGSRFETREDAGVLEFLVDGTTLLLIGDGSRVAGPDTLHLVTAPLDERLAARVPVLSLVDYRSSSCTMFPSRIREWLSHARVIGLRFYPTDES